MRLAITLFVSHAAATWTSLAPIPIGTLQEHIALVTSPSQLVTIGGLVSNGSTTDLTLLYDIPSNTWKRGTGAPTGLNHPNAVSHDGKIYLLGGLTGASGWRASPNSWVYDPATDKWSTLASMPASEARGSAASAVHNGTVYLAGGIPSSGGRTMDLVTAYDIPTNTWVSLPDNIKKMPGARDHASYATVGTKFYVLGGRADGVAAVKDTVFILDLSDLSKGWRTSEAKMPTARGGLVAAAVGNKIYTFGGEGNPAPSTRGVFPETEVFDTVSETWEKLEGMKIPRHGTSAAAVGGKIYIPGGGIIQGMGATEAFDVFTP
ncbi:hypothetical protein OQA88_5915 [Cercophora sp. LCS_1]